MDRQRDFHIFDYILGLSELLHTTRIPSTLTKDTQIQCTVHLSIARMLSAEFLITAL